MNDDKRQSTWRKDDWKDRLGFITAALAIALVTTLIVTSTTFRTEAPATMRSTRSEQADTSLVLPQLNPGLSVNQAYPLPMQPTPTIVPPGQYYPIPQGMPVQVVSLQTAPDAAILTTIQHELDGEDATALAGRISPNSTLMHRLDSPCTRYVDATQAATVLQDLFAQGSHPMIQGYFRSYRSTENSQSIIMVITGWEGQTSLPDPDPIEGCEYWSTMPAFWFFQKKISSPDSGWLWTEWNPQTPYEDAVLTFSGGTRTYYVMRP